MGGGLRGLSPATENVRDRKRNLPLYTGDLCPLIGTVRLLVRMSGRSSPIFACGAWSSISGIR